MASAHALPPVKVPDPSVLKLTSPLGDTRPATSVTVAAQVLLPEPSVSDVGEQASVVVVWDRFSKAPMSQRLGPSLDTPLWSALGQVGKKPSTGASVFPASIAGLPVSRAMVGVGPPLSPSVPSIGVGLTMSPVASKPLQPGSSALRRLKPDDANPAPAHCPSAEEAPGPTVFPARIVFAM